MTRKLYEIAAEVQQDIAKNPRPKYIAMCPYLRAMHDLSDMKDNYGADTAQRVVLCFLSNAGQWKGEVARRVKAELKQMLRANGYKI